ncbi:MULTISPECIES: lipid IV(A) 3-deoxy-D-manno-octulosonic acid transferase [Ralstonia]|uniref:3-deoxy-D-manno-octulosonic acid transferase n=1 Tax=Ralstonia holmesii TaxID=3058602 RepID=A0ABC8QE58_9RALS|nr:MULTISPECIES: lipid IV(A) 3-deoxy-D-manno-octulosonic acid transferase [unclassified Ralstonia]CAJ0787486.1 3-deoxy-D-manno-octulosonic acid transferase [Ralstonia sp. LMG 32967]CAJ0808326.1 3-deoxy-D-manno-octulosonic acid transferase [Ralstonia sp. LMG 32967]
MLRVLYRWLWRIALPFALLRLWWRGRKEPGYRQHVGERLGFYPPRPNPDRPLLWVHAVSVGETRAAQPLIDALLARFPHHAVLLTHMTPTGRRTGAEFAAQRNGRVIQAYLPYDLPSAVDRFLRHFQPRLGLLMETEIWPVLIERAYAAGVPMVLVNGRLSARSHRRTARLGDAARQTYAQLAAVLAQTPDDADRYRSLGVPRVRVTGNLKFDITPHVDQIMAGRVLRDALRGRSAWVAASTREGEEALLLDAWQAHRAQHVGRRHALLILVPRHPQRFDEVAQAAERAGLRVVRRSALSVSAAGVADADALADADVLLGDSMGEMALYYAAAEAAFIGGSLLPLGGQNLIEACAVGTPVVIGPHTFNFAQATRDAVAAGACKQVEDAAGVMRVIDAWLSDADARESASRAALAFAATHGGATARTVEAVASLVLPTL